MSEPTRVTDRMALAAVGAFRGRTPGGSLIGGRIGSEEFGRWHQAIAAAIEAGPERVLATCGPPGQHTGGDRCDGQRVHHCRCTACPCPAHPWNEEGE